MKWLLLNQLFVSLDYKNYETSVLEEVVSSEEQLVLLLASGTVSQKTMNSVFPEGEDFNPLVLGGHL